MCMCTFVKEGSVCIVRISIRDLFEFGRRVLSVLFRHCESWGLEWSSLHKWTLPLLNMVTYVVLWTGGDTSALNRNPTVCS